MKKRNRNNLKNLDPLANFPRQAMPSNFPAGGEAEVLADPKLKLPARLRKKYSKSRAHIVCVPRSAAVAEPIKYAKWLSSRSLVQVLREVQKNARRAATAKNILSELSLATNFGQTVLAEQNRHLHRMRQAKAEWKSRMAESLLKTTTSLEQAVK